ncbi:hypothetical protein BDV41DRAFT_577073 [Aspergillus transmontanensis]|uniref:Uncharacterized protein n=1 Tax=Aspergillus transmontanensis TaxID=1034304 RepID=A0A5N6VXV6_9EURO|nr:hypothetical protein BDV41DRAFT_577073 [Aspergillus transmontanensis]
MAALVFLRVLPLLTTSSYLTFTIAEDLYFKPYLEPSVVGVADHLLPSYITVWYNRGMVLIFTIYLLTWCTAIASLPVAHLRHTSIAAFILYLIGLLFNIAHMLWGPHAMNLLNSIKKQDSSGSTEILRR